MRIIKTLSLKKATAHFTLFLIAFAACQQDNEILNSIDTQNVNSESASSALINESSDMATKLISSLTRTQYAGGRLSASTIAFTDSRLSGATVRLYPTGTVTAPAGTILIAFMTKRTGTISCTTDSKTVTGSGTLFSSSLAAGSILVDSLGAVIGTVGTIASNTSLTLIDNAAVALTASGYGISGVTDGQGIIRKGQIKIAYSGKRWTPGSYYKIKLINFYRNSAHIEGTELTNFTGTTGTDTLQLKFEATLDSGKITFGDGESVARTGTLYKTWVRYIDINTGKIDPLKGELHVTGSGTGVNKLGKSYVWDITSELVYSLSCWISNKIYIPVKGKKTFTIDNSNTTYTINYDDETNDGNCDNQVIVTFNGREKTINVTGDGN